jgi:hypothetical protein
MHRVSYPKRMTLKHILGSRYLICSKCGGSLPLIIVSNIHFQQTANNIGDDYEWLRMH